jgi:pantothenate kinase
MDGPWEPLRSLVDIGVYLHLDDGVRRQRLIDRHVRHGRSLDAATEWVDRSDEANARLVASTADRADHVLVVD